MRYLVSRHEAVKQWLTKQGIRVDKRIEHLDINQINTCDEVIGNLPIHLIEQLNSKGASYQHIVLSMAENERGTELTLEQMEANGARLEKYVAAKGSFSVEKLKVQIKNLPRTVRRSYLKLEQHPIVLWLYTSFSLLCLAWLGDAFAGGPVFQYADIALVPKDTPSYFNPRVVFLVSIAFMLISWRLFVAGKKFVRPIKEVKMQRESSPSKVVLLNLSLGWAKLDFSAEGTSYTVHFNNELKLTLAGKTLQEDLGILKEHDKQYERPRWNWAQILRGISVHIDELECLVVLLTDEAAKQKQDIEKILRLYLADSVDLRIHDKTVDIASVNQAYQVYDDVINGLVKSKYDEEEITADITSGTSIQSAAFAMATLHNKTQFQYVINGSEKDIDPEKGFAVLQYDLQLVPANKK